MSTITLRTCSLICSLAVAALWGNPLCGQSGQVDSYPPIVSADACCDQCYQNPCRCRLGHRLKNPNRFRVAPGPVDSGMYAPAPQVAPDMVQRDVAPDAVPPSIDPLAQPDQPSAVQPSADTFALSSGLGSGREAFAADATTIGDFFAGGAIVTGPTWGQVPIVLPLAGGDRRYKLTEHTSPIPTDRMFVDYHVFNDAVVDANGNDIDLNRYLFGFERTFGQGNMSWEVRIPFANGADSQQVQNIGAPPIRANEFGNVSLTTKALLYRDECHAVSAGLGVIFPTADGSVLTSQGGGTIVEIENSAYHLQPFFAVQRNLRQDCWVTFYTQCDFATDGNSVTSSNLNGLNVVDSYTDQNLLFLDLSFGRWLYRDRSGCARVRGIAGIVELHYSSTMNDTDVAIAGNPSNFDPFPPPGRTSQDVISNPYNRLDVLNATAGLRFLCGPCTVVTVGGVAPLRDDEESLFDNEFVLQISRLH